MKGLDDNGFWSFNLKDLVWFGVVLATVTWTIALMPQKIAADMTDRFASRERVDYICERLDKIDIKMDKLVDLVQR